ncbi:RES family NAD+ phosphorylase [Pseudomonas orientalis]|uniref:RES family NAD+ phosphorylase n=1 Tax=Pseudomonas orientalis TaxID=76758 RepID=UPI0010235E16|nr:RES family NAD+ phosphorylase [Pseudomonas orientalis]RZI26815.1 RES domain-containing protein [Pseudomonas orientalis]
MNGTRITDQFPPMELETLSSYVNDFYELSFLEQENFVSRLVDIHPVLSIEWQGQDLARVRKLSPLQNVSSVADVVWPEGQNPSPGRINVDGRPVVYLATSRDTALKETHVKDDSVALSYFSPMADASIRLCPIGEICLILRQGRGQVIQQESAKDFLGFLNHCPKEQLRAIAIADAFLCELLTQSSGDYKLTSLVPQAIFQKNEAIDAFLYPSQMQLAGTNVAIRRDRFWSSWGLTSVSQAKATHLGAGFYKLSEISKVTGIYTSGAFQWADEIERDESLIRLTPWQPNTF